MSQDEEVTKFDKMKNELKVRSTHYLLGGLSLVASLGWNEAIKKYIAKVYSPKDSANAALVYAIAITVFLIIVIMILPNTETLMPKPTQEKLHECQYKKKI